MISVRKGVLRNFSKFAGKHLCQSLFFKKVAGLIFFIERLQKTASVILTTTKLINQSRKKRKNELPNYKFFMVGDVETEQNPEGT